MSAPDLPPPGGFLIRAVALILDGAWMGLVALLSTIPFRGPLGAIGGTVFLGVLLFLGFLVPVLGWWLWGSTPGKAVLGLSVRSLDGAVPITLGRALARWLATWVSSVVIGLGFLMVAFAPNRRALHDLAAGTYVARRR
jgi:uncharacterized RDD family membrane protein YckC